MFGLQAEVHSAGLKQGQWKGTRGAMTLSSGITSDGEGESSLVSSRRA